jgi:hypothetical protein
MNKIYRVDVLGWMDIVYFELFSDERIARNVYSAKVAEELDREKESKEGDGWLYSKNDVDLVELVENEDSRFVYNQTLLNFEGDHS